MPIFRHPLIAHHPDQLTIDWAQQVIDQHLTDTLVKQVNIISVDTGTTTRIRIKVDHNGPKSFPRYWFIKIPSLSWRARLITALPRLLHTEIRFYKELVENTPVKTPIALSATSLFGRGSTLVLNDITEHRGIAGSANDTYSAKQASLFIEQLAKLHAKYWNKTNNHPKYNWLAGPIRRLEDALGSALAVPLMKQGLKKAGDLVPQSLHKPAIQYAHNRRKAMRFLNQRTQTIIHHDCHPGNLFWHDKTPGLLDWQMVRIGEGISDIAYFLATSLSPNTRKDNEHHLITHYVQSLKKQGITNINPKQMYTRYRAHLLYPFEAMLVTLAIGEMMDLKANHTLINRTSAAIDDNNTFLLFPL